MMEITYDRDDARRLIVVTPQGECDPSDVLRVLERQRAEGAWSYGLLYDVRQMTGFPDLTGLRSVFNTVAAYSTPEHPRGPIAVLTLDPGVYGAACTYAAMAYATMQIQVFRDLHDASLWLATATRP